MKKLLAASVILAYFVNPAYAWNPIRDFRDNVVWTLGKAGEIGEAVKIAGGGNIANGETTTSFLAGVADYRIFTLSYGGTRVNHQSSELTDTAKVGLKLSEFFDWFKNPPTPEMAFLRNLNIGPSVAMPLLSNPRVATILIDINYQFGNLTSPK